MTLKSFLLKKKIIINKNGVARKETFINNQFNYASIIWMFCNKQDYFEVEKIHYKTLKIVYNSNECYEELLIRNNEVSIHQKQLLTLATEI